MAPHPAVYKETSSHIIKPSWTPTKLKALMMLLWKWKHLQIWSTNHTMHPILTTVQWKVLFWCQLLGRCHIKIKKRVLFNFHLKKKLLIRGGFVLNCGWIFLHFIKACPDLAWLDQIYCSGYKLYCRRYWPDLPEVCRKRPRKKKMDLTKNNFSLTAFFLWSQSQHFADTCRGLTDVFEGEKNGNIWSMTWKREMAQLWNSTKKFSSPAWRDLQSGGISWIRLFPSISKQIPVTPLFPIIHCGKQADTNCWDFCNLIWSCWIISLFGRRVQMNTQCL